MNDPVGLLTWLRVRSMAWLRRPDILLPWVVLAVTLSITHYLWRQEQQEARHALQADFDFLVHESTARILGRMQDYQQVLRGAQGLFATNAGISRDEFHDYVATLRVPENFPGIQGLSFAQIVPAARKQEHIAAIRRAGFTNYAIKPEGERDRYTPVVYIEPFAGRNLHAFGHDPYSDPMRRAAMEHARDLDCAAITGKLVLVQEDGRRQHPGFMMYLPIYKRGTAASLAARRANIIGWVAAPFRMNDLMQGIYGEQAAAIDIEIYDGREMSSQTLMNDSDGQPGSRNNARYQAIRQLGIAGHLWTVALRSHPGFEARLEREKARFIAGAGIGTSVLLTLLTWLLVNGRARAIKTAQRMNRELIESEARLSEIAATLGEGVYVLDQQGLITFTNPELQRILGWSGAELLGRNAHALFHLGADDERSHSPYLCEIEMTVRFGQSYRSESKRFCRKDGSMLPVSVSASPILGDGRVLGSVVAFHDISERKQAEMALAAESYKNEMLLRMASDGIHILDAEGNILQVNDAFCQMLGYSPEEMQGMNVKQWDAQWSECELKAKIGQLMQMRKGAVFETRHRCKDGRELDVEINAIAVEISGKCMLYASARDVTERKRVGEALRASEERWSFALEGAGDGVWDWNIQTGEVLFSRRWKAMLGFAEEEIENSFAAWETRVHPEDKPQVMAKLLAYLGGELAAYAIEYRILCKDGSWRWVLARGKIVSHSAEGKPLRMIGTHTDISQRREREEALQLAATVFDTVDEAVTVTDADNRIITVNPAFTRITGYTPEDVVGRNPHVLASGTHPPQFYEHMWGTLLGSGSWSGEICNRRKNGELYIEWLSIKLVRDDTGRHTHYVGIFSDISARKAAEERIHHLAHYDVLTDLPNRMLIADRIQQALAQARRDKAHMALMFIDLDRFKPINDTLGHNIGDLLLQEVARRLLDCVRESDTVARIGGDEFIVLLPHTESDQDAMVVAAKILHTLNQPFQVGGHMLGISSSIGIAAYPEHGMDERSLIKNADTAMYHAKEQGRNNAQIFHSDMVKKRRA